jgi:hypothetical protein
MLAIGALWMVMERFLPMTSSLRTPPTMRVTTRWLFGSSALGFLTHLLKEQQMALRIALQLVAIIMLILAFRTWPRDKPRVNG